MFQMQWRELCLRALLADGGRDAEGESQNVESFVQSLTDKLLKIFFQLLFGP